MAEALIHRPICIFSPPKHLIVDKDSVLMDGIIQFILLTINCQLKYLITSIVVV